MGFVMPHVTILAGIGVAGLAIIFQIVGLATPGWIVFGEHSSGLFRVCISSSCVDIPLADDALKACRAFGILAVLVIVACLVLAVLICFMSEQKIFLKATPATALAAALCILLEFAVFAGEYSASSKNFGYSFGLTVAAFVLCAIATVLFFLGHSKSGA